MIRNNIDDDFSAARERFIWMPSHESVTAIGSTLHSQGQPITATMWRANRLADALAKTAADRDRLPRWVTRWVKTAATAAREAAALLGVVTFAANNLATEISLPDGRKRTVQLRDSCGGDRPPWKKRRAGDTLAGTVDTTSPEASCPSPLPADDDPGLGAPIPAAVGCLLIGPTAMRTGDPSWLQASVPSLPDVRQHPAGQRKMTSAAKARALANAAELRQATRDQLLVASRFAAATRKRPEGPDAASRIEAVRRRVLARSARESSDAGAFV